MIFFLSEKQNKLDKIISIPLSNSISNHPSFKNIFSNSIMDNKNIFLKGGCCQISYVFICF